MLSGFIFLIQGVIRLRYYYSVRVCRILLLFGMASKWHHQVTKCGEQRNVTTIITRQKNLHNHLPCGVMEFWKRNWNCASVAFRAKVTGMLCYSCFVEWIETLSLLSQACRMASAWWRGVMCPSRPFAWLPTISATQLGLPMIDAVKF